MKISEVSEKYGLTIDTLRYYERVGLIPPVNRTDSGIRDYNDLDLRRVEFVKCMRNAGLPVDVLVEYVGLVQQGDQTTEARRAILIEQRDRILANVAELQEVLELLDHKIEIYDQTLMKLERNLNEIEKV